MIDLSKEPSLDSDCGLILAALLQGKRLTNFKPYQDAMSISDLGCLNGKGRISDLRNIFGWTQIEKEMVKVPKRGGKETEIAIYSIPENMRKSPVAAPKVQNGTLSLRGKQNSTEGKLLGTTYIEAGRQYWLESKTLEKAAKELRIPKSKLLKKIEELNLPTRPRGAIPFPDTANYLKWVDKIKTQNVEA